ncbi:MAG TPA: hypothetical protein VFN10_01530 [Thermoanaerobaculia bacterium]|nr:hypothetical protein [Thermoanaerobaculia bacterium]
MSASSWPEPAQPYVEDEVTTAPQTERQPESQPASPRWSLATRVAFRFAFVYLILYNFPVIFTLVEATQPIAEKIDGYWLVIVKPVALAVFGAKAELFPTGSGDTTFSYVLVFVMAAIAAMATLIWSILDRRRANYAKLYVWLRVIVRYSLAVAMVSYGAAKVIKMQFPDPTLDRLVQPLGDMSPMGLLWTFMGFSKPYNIFTGAAEMLGGLLLTTRRTTLLGALVTAGVMANVAMMNFAYDVPVKLYSTQLLLMALFLTLPDLQRLANFFVFNRATEPTVLAPKTWRWLPIVRTLLVALFVITSLRDAHKYMLTRQSWTAASPLQGIWSVDELSVDGVAHPPLTTDHARWRRLIVNGGQSMLIQNMDDTRKRHMIRDDVKEHMLWIFAGHEDKRPAKLTYERRGADTVLLSGMFEGKKIAATLHKEPHEFLLTTRGFHWITELPFNR